MGKKKKNRKSQWCGSTRDLSIAEVRAVRHRVVEEARSRGSMLFGVSGKAGDLGIADGLRLESAVDRQSVAMGGIRKYPNPHLSAASLTYGIVKDHPFLDGNKRTALICMLVHLDKNSIVVNGVRHKMLVTVMENVAEDIVPVNASVIRRETVVRIVTKGALRLTESDRADTVVKSLASFVERHSRKWSKGPITNMTYAELRRLLQDHGFVLESPKGNAISVFKRGILRKKHVTTIGWPGESKTVRPGAIQMIRMKLGLDVLSGVDKQAFLNVEDVADKKIQEYQSVLKRLESR